MKKNLFLIFPYKGVGGVSVLFKRAAEWLVERNFSVKVIDYSDGFISKSLYNRNIEIINYDGPLIKIPKDSICLMQSMTPWTIFKNIKFNNDTKIFFWNCHPNNLIPSIPIFSNFFENNLTFKKLLINLFLSKYKNSSKTFLELLLKTESIAFMDDENIKNTRFFLDHKIRKFQKLPIPIFLSKETKEIKSVSKGTLKLTWIGRIEDFKTKSLEKVIDDLEKTIESSHKNIIFNVIGDGEDLQIIKEKALNSGLTFNFFDYLNTDELNKFLKEDTDLLFAMGTSALEGGQCSIPTVLLDISHTKLKTNYKYKWLFETKNYNLGEVLHKKFSGSGTHDIKNIIENTILNKTKIGMQCREYVESNHSSEIVFKNLESFLNNSSLKWEDLSSSKVIKSGLIYKVRKLFRDQKSI